MKKKNSLLCWAPRIFGIIFIVFVGLLSMDVFGLGYSLWETVIAFFMHNLPTLFLIVILGISWKWAKIGALLWIGAGFCFLGIAGGRVPAGGLILMTGIPMTIGFLFAIQYFLEKK